VVGDESRVGIDGPPQEGCAVRSLCARCAAAYRFRKYVSPGRLAAAPPLRRRCAAAAGERRRSVLPAEIVLSLSLPPPPDTCQISLYSALQTLSEKEKGRRS